MISGATVVEDSIMGQTISCGGHFVMTIFLMAISKGKYIAFFLMLYYHFRVHLAFSALYYPPQLIVWPIILSSTTVALLIVQHIILSSTMIFLKLTSIKYMYTKYKPV